MKNVMKILAVFILMTAIVQAQEKPCCARKVKEKVELMKQKLSLSENQATQLTLLLKEPKADFESELKRILTAKQYLQFQENYAEKSCCAKKSTKKKSCCKKK